MSERKKVLMLATTAAMIEQFNKQNIQILCELGYEVHVVGNFNEGNPISSERLNEFKTWLKCLDCRWFDNVSTRKPYDIKNNYKAYTNVLKLIRENDYAFIHCHNPIGAVIGRLSGHKTKTRVIYTAHGFHFFKGARILNWLLYYPVEKFLSKYTDTLIVINSEDYELAKKRFHMKRLEFIHGIGIDLEKYKKDITTRINKRKELLIQDGDIAFLSVGELIKRKNYYNLIKAFSLIDNKNIKLIICGQGDEEKKLISIIEKYNLTDRIVLLGYRTDVNEILNACDYFIFPSLQEGLPVSLMEAMASKIPIICSNIRGNNDLITNNCYLFNPKDINDIKDKIMLIIQDDNYDIEQNYYTVIEYATENIRKKMKQIYMNY